MEHLGRQPSSKLWKCWFAASTIAGSSKGHPTIFKVSFSLVKRFTVKSVNPTCMCLLPILCSKMSSLFRSKSTFGPLGHDAQVEELLEFQFEPVPVTEPLWLWVTLKTRKLEGLLGKRLEHCTSFSNVRESNMLQITFHLEEIFGMSHTSPESSLIFTEVSNFHEIYHSFSGTYVFWVHGSFGSISMV